MQVLQPDGWPRPRGYSNGFAVDGPGRWVVLAGQTGPGEDGIYPADFAAQVGNSLRRIVTVLREAGAGPEHIVRLNWYITTPAEYEAAGAGIGAVWGETLGRAFPPATLLFVSGLAAPDAKVEIEVTAFVPQA